MPNHKRKQKHRKTRKHKGGKYVGEGSYGCGYLPALRCEGEAERTPGMFSKIMLQSEAEIEFDIGQRWFRPVDPRHQYFLYPMRICPINQDVLPNPENNLEKCQGKYESLDESRLLQYYNGGPNLYEVALTADDFLPYFSGFKNLFDGLVKLHRYGIAHMDIKLQNTVGQKDTPKSFHLRFIDFGLAINSQEADYPFNEEGKNRYAKTYFAWPFDTRFIVEGFTKSKITPIYYKQFLINAPALVRYVPADIFYQEDYATYQYEADEIKEIYYEFLDEIPNEEKIPFIIRGTDVYSMGILLATSYGKKIGHFYNFNKMYVQDPDSLIGRIPFESLQGILPEDVYQWHTEVFTNISIPLYNLVKKMMNQDPFFRINIEQARAQYLAILPSMSRLFKPSLIENGLRFLRPNISAAPIERENTAKPFSLSPLQSKKNRNTRKIVLRVNAPEFVPGKPYMQ